MRTIIRSKTDLEILLVILSVVIGLISYSLLTGANYATLTRTFLSLDFATYQCQVAGYQNCGKDSTGKVTHGSCFPGYTDNGQTCILQHSANPPLSSATSGNQCPSGTSWNGNQCIIVCPPGQTANSVSQTCSSSASSSTAQPQNAQPSTGSTTCPSGQIFSTNYNQCIPTSCPAGQVWNSDLVHCVTNNSPPSSVSGAPNPAGTTSDPAALQNQINSLQQQAQSASTSSQLAQLQAQISQLQAQQANAQNQNSITTFITNNPLTVLLLTIASLFAIFLYHVFRKKK